MVDVCVRVWVYVCVCVCVVEQELDVECVGHVQPGLVMRRELGDLGLVLHGACNTQHISKLHS
jgi:hypothetical protein